MAPRSPFAVCAENPDHGPAVGGNIASRNDLCRDCWRKAEAPNLVEVEVTGEYPIASVDGRDAVKGERALLHPGDTNIDLLVYAGAVRRVEAKAPAKKG